MMMLIAALGVVILGIGLLGIAFCIWDVRDEILRFRQDLMVVMQRQSGQSKGADVGAYMEQELRRQGRWREKQR